LRLEHLFRRLGELVERESPTDHHYAITTIFEIMDVGARADLKSDVLKDLEKTKAGAQRLPRQPGDFRSRA
jgi:cell division protein ZapD